MTDTTTAGPTGGTATSERPPRQWSDRRRAAAARGAAEKRRRQAEAESTRPDVELVAEDQIAEAVANITTLAGFMLPVAPYTAITLAGVPHPERPREWIVQSRAEMAGRVLLEHAKRNRRVLAAIARFNLMFRNVELIEVAGALVASVAVDAHVVPPDATIALPGGIQMPILAPAIGDTIDYIASQSAPDPRAGAVKLERQTRRTESAEGVDEPGEPWGPTAGQDSPTAEQLAQARAMRERLAERDERIRNGTDPTVRREGQVIVPGGMQDT